jgi:mannose-6-phosphate isomerase
MVEPENWLGREHLDFFGASTEVLVKLLDPDQRLPVHFHPNRKFSKEYLSLGHGKTEAWIILDAPVNATVGLGFKEEFTKEEILRLVTTLDSTALLASLHKVNVRKGDAILVPSGVPHAIGPGIFLLELQEPTDLSVLLEWNDFAVDGAKDGHLGLGFDCVLDALRYSPISIEEMRTLISHDNLGGTSDKHIFSEASNPYFRADFLTGNLNDIDSGFAVLLVLDGVGKVDFSNHSSIAVSKGDALVIPSSAGSWGISEACGLVCRPPLPKFANLAV